MKFTSIGAGICLVDVLGAYKKISCKTLEVSANLNLPNVPVYTSTLMFLVDAMVLMNIIKLCRVKSN